MEAFGIEEGACGSGGGTYALGLLTLPDGSARGVETVIRVCVRSDADSGLIGRTASVAGSVRDALGAPKAASLPWRFALSTIRAGLGAIEEGLRPDESVTVEIGFGDGTEIAATMRPEIAALIRRDAQVARGAIERAGHTLVADPVASAADTAPDEALTSIFRYEKRQGRLRRVAGSGKPEG